MKKLNKITIFAICILAIALTVGSTLAFLIDSDGPVENTFTGSKVTSEVEETLVKDENGALLEKKDVKIKNTGDTPAYIRAAVVVTWKKLEEDGTYSVYGMAPVENTHYEMQWSGLTDQSWEKGTDGFYYYKSVVNDGESTSVLFTDCKLKDGATAPAEGYYLNVEIICSAIQAGQDGYGEAYNAWKGVAVND